MLYYSTKNKDTKASLQEAVVNGLAPDRGLYMPEHIPQLPAEFFEEIVNKSLPEIASVVAKAFFGDDINKDNLDSIVTETLNFDIPLKEIDEDIYVLELFHGPTFAFKDVGARFMARMLSFFIKERKQDDVKVLVATSGDTGSAVANGFLGVDGIQVFVLYPSGKVSKMQEAQFTTLGQNIVAIEVDGTFDDCQSLVKSAFMDEELNIQLNLTSANSINVARFLPQSFYYFCGFAQIAKTLNDRNLLFSVPSGNLGNLTAGLFAKRMGLPVNRFFAANNRNDVFYKYLNTGEYQPKPSVQTIANAMDVGAPSNFDRILDLYGGQHESISRDIKGFSYNDSQIEETISNLYKKSGYILDPHSACAYQALKEGKKPGETGILLATAHPAKFRETVERCIDSKIEIPADLEKFTLKQKHSYSIPNDFNIFKKALINLT
ncbi:MAG: threonine synthase [Fermentimonas sp.]|nr:threonine synthase [Fermentimonas sp.]